MGQNVALPTVEDFESIVRYVEDVRGFVQAFHPAELCLFKAREERFRYALAFLVTGDEPPKDGRLTFTDCTWVEEHVKDARKGIFPEGCAARFKAARTVFKT